MSIAAIVTRMQQIAAGIQRLGADGAYTSGVPGASALATAAAPVGSGPDFAGALAQALTGAAPSSAAPAVHVAAGAPATAVAGAVVDNGTTGADVVADARKYLGVPYVFGGTTTAGLDCSGLVQKVFGDLGISVPRLVTGQMKVGVAVPSLAQAQPGDLIVADGGDHIAIYAGDGQIIEAPHPGLSVRERSDWITAANTVTIRRIVPSASSASSSASAAPSVTAAALLAGWGASR
ncbi:MAG TPA: C40 family peptidase [Microbacteriaceae bacterium]|nr:C40 family peptidase [Microbacteriaceae bacterium]